MSTIAQIENLCQAIDLSMKRYALCKKNKLPDEAEAHLRSADHYAYQLGHITNFHQSCQT